MKNHYGSVIVLFNESNEKDTENGGGGGGGLPLRTEGYMLDMNWLQPTKDLVNLNQYIVFQKVKHFWVAKATVTQKVFNTASGSRQYSLVELIVPDKSYLTFQYSELIML